MSVLDDMHNAAVEEFKGKNPDYIVCSSNMWATLMAMDWLSRNNWVNNLYGYSMVKKIRQEFLDNYLDEVRG